MRLLDGCDLVALLTPDAFPEPEWLAALIAAEGGHPEAASFASRLMLDERPGILDGAGDVCHVSGLVWRHGHGQPLSAVPDALDARPAFSACAAAALYRRDGLKGGHVIQLGPGIEAAAREALQAYPGGLQVGGGVSLENAPRWLDAGASHVIVTSWVSREGRVDRDRLRALRQAIGKERLVLDLSCGRRANAYRSPSGAR